MANLVGDTTVSDNTSHASSTLSEFMARRVNGFPVFGGDVRTGATELYGATAASARGAEAVVRGQVSQLVQALQVFQSGLAGGTPPITPVTPRPIVRNSEIRMYDPGDISLADLQLAANLDEGKVMLLLGATDVEPVDVSQFAAAVRYAIHIAARKVESIREKTDRKVMKNAGATSLSYRDDSVMWNNESVRTVTDMLKFRSEELNFRYIALALTHDTCYQGRQTNRGWAQFGDVVLRMAVVEYAVGMDVQPLVGDVNDACELAQGGQVQCQRALDNHLQDYVFVANGVKPSTREVLSTVVSALYGVAYHMQGERGTALVDEKFGLLRDAHAALDMSVLRVSDGLRDVPVGMSATSPPVERVDMDWHKRVNSILPGYGLIA